MDSLNLTSMQDAMQTSSQQVIELTTTYGMSVIGALVILFIGWTASRWARRITLNALTRAKVDLTLARFISSLARYAIMAFTIIAVLSKFGVQTASLIAVMGAAGLAIGLALQGTLSHVAAGVMLLLFRPFKIGDYVEGGGQAGTVEEIGLFATTMNTPDNVRIIIPNSQLWDASIKNYSANTNRRVDWTIGIGYADNIDLAMKAILATLKKDKRIRTTPAEPMVAVSNLGESSVDLTVRVWCKGADFWSIKFDMTKAIKEVLDKEGISIPFPQRDLHIVSDATASGLKKAS
ncbi:MAG: mechanosensitive ion channel [Alphaproteobacteria bacterium]|nr:mechanosensitive ion channel [Alphaproteobacteria bacterium]